MKQTMSDLLLRHTALSHSFSGASTHMIIKGSSTTNYRINSIT